MPVNFMASEREILEALLPGLDERLCEIPFLERERPRNGSVAAFRDAGGPGLLVPREYGGIGATALQAVRIQRAVATRSPSLAVATTMHHFSLAGLLDAAATSGGLDWTLLESIATQRQLLASGFAEGRPGQGILTPTMKAEPSDGGFLVSGSKKPCSLAHSMDLLTASVALPAQDGGSELAVVLVPATDEGIERRPFWNTPILAGAESEEVILRGVEVPETLIVRTGASPGEPIDGVQVTGFLWFELLMTASYLGAATALVERVLDAGRGSAGDRASLAGAVQATMAAIEGTARAMDAGERDEQALATALFVRYAAQDAITRCVASAVELLGGMAYILSPEVAYLAGACAALAFHPPSRASAAQSLVDALAGNSLRIA
jgi:alkylation response protein AidB-like acyl-CoA dehydrogenase